jgi:hypothetical protein
MKMYAERFGVNPSNFKLYDIDRWHLEVKITNRIGKSSGDGLAYSSSRNSRAQETNQNI